MNSTGLIRELKRAGRDSDRVRGPHHVFRRPDPPGHIVVVSLDPAALDDTTERVNITLPRRVLKRLEVQARAAGESRSGYIAQLTLAEPLRAA